MPACNNQHMLLRTSPHIKSIDWIPALPATLSLNEPAWREMQSITFISAAVLARAVGRRLQRSQILTL